MLQETHWAKATAPVWASGVFPHTAVVQTCARQGPRGGAQGGTAILIPSPLELISWSELVPGCAVSARTRDPSTGQEATRVSLYFPPGQQLTVARELLRGGPLRGPVFVGCN
eukprot:1059780-Lingulodinium_polyedra.AAC.1